MTRPELVDIVFPTLTIRAVVARTEADRAHGLMFVPRLKPRHGMLLAFPERDDHRLWMRHVKIPLDMIFLDDIKVVGIVHFAQPNTDTMRSIDKPSLYVLEVDGGTAATHHLTPGTNWSMRR